MTEVSTESFSDAEILTQLSPCSMSVLFTISKANAGACQHLFIYVKKRNWNLMKTCLSVIDP